MADTDKRALIQQLRDDLKRTTSVLAKAARDAREAATHEEAKPENDKDTRAVEAAYLAGAQADRVRDLERVSAFLGSLDLRTFGPGAIITATALVELDLDGARFFYFLAPEGGGLSATVGGIEVQVITPQSPLGRELLGKSQGDVIEVKFRGSVRSYSIEGVS